MIVFIYRKRFLGLHLRYEEISVAIIYLHTRNVLFSRSHVPNCSYIWLLGYILGYYLTVLAKRPFFKKKNNNGNATFGFWVLKNLNLIFQYQSDFPSSIKEHAVFADMAPRFHLMAEEILQRQIQIVIFNLREVYLQNSDLELARRF